MKASEEILVAEVNRNSLLSTACSVGQTEALRRNEVWIRDMALPVSLPKDNTKASVLWDV